MADAADEKHMQLALKLAAKGRGGTSPNPMVGAVLVRDGQIVGQGYHKKAGGPHAEVNAISAAGKDAQNATLYVTLEPCNHHGRTPPCTKAILDAKIKRVVVGMRDPNPNVKGGGIEFLKSRGIDVKWGIQEAQCKLLNEAFITFIEKKRPFVIMKAATSLDGKIATGSGDAKWITSEESRLLVHRLRNEVDAILVGIGTVLQDDPQLTTRLPKGKGRNPVRVVLDSRLRTPVSAKVADASSDSSTILVVSEDIPESRKKPFLSRGVEVIAVSKRENGLNLLDLLTKLARRGIVSLLVEGGGSVFSSFLNAGLIDKYYLFYAPIIVGGDRAFEMAGGCGVELIKDARRLERLKIKRIGQDFLVEAYPHAQ